MNVTNRRKSTDAETPPATQTPHHHSQQQPHQSLLAYISCRQAATVSSNRNSRSRLEEEQEQLVTSTSTDSVLPLQAEGEGEEVAIELETSPAHITSSTHNYDIVNHNSVDSLSLEEMVMPSTSENARLETEESSIRKVHLSNINNNRSTKSSSSDMVARDINLRTVADGGCGGGGNGSGAEGGVSLRDLDDQSTSTSNIMMDSLSHSENHKIILKLPKSVASESHTISINEDDLRKVEPLKINLHNTHHHFHHHSVNTHHTPKITIKPILKEPPTAEALVSSEECSSSAEDEMVSKLNNSEPHIIPKLTIRAKNENYASSQTTVVPKLTIKINDSGISEPLSTPSAANTPPLPKLTIKTGQDGHSESIITNVSPASSTTSSSSSLASSSATSSSSSNYLMATPSMSIPKLTIKPLQKSQDSKSGQSNEPPPSIPKLCIKTNMLCTDAVEESTGSKIPKLTIKTGQERAVIITQHSDCLKASGIPRLTIKTKSLDVPEEANVSEGAVVEKIPKLTIKTNASTEISKICRNKAPMEAVNATTISPLSPKQQTVPKLTISRQTAQMERLLDIGEGIPKITIKTQNKSDCVPKLTLKPLSNRPSSTEESGISDDPEDEEVEQVLETSKIIPKLTIKNVGSPQQKLKIVVDTDAELNTNSNPLTAPNSRVDLLTTAEDVDEFSDLLNVDNAGGESSNSQEFCGFNENIIADCSPNKQIMVVTSITTNTEDMDLRRHSDDMDIDETLRTQHEPEMFQNIAHFNAQGSSNSTSSQEAELNGNVALDLFSKIIDTVDLTSSAGSSPAHRFDYNDDEEEEENTVTEQSANATNELVPTTNILLERLQRETTVIQNTQQLKLQAENNSTPPPLHPKPNVINKSPASLKYPQLAERLKANGSAPVNVNACLQATNHNTAENIIDSIEILDTPEGSPRNSLDERPQTINVIQEKSPLPNGLHYPKETQIIAFNNNNLNLKRHASVPHKDMDCQTSADTSSKEELPPKLRKLQNDNINMNVVLTNNEFHSIKESHSYAPSPQNTKSELNCLKQSITTSQPTLSNHQRSRKQKHEHILPLPMDEEVYSMQTNSNDSLDLQADNGGNDTNESATPVAKRRGRPKKSDATIPPPNAKEETINSSLPTFDNKQDNKSRRVQLLRKRLAIDMVDAEPPIPQLVDDMISAIGMEDKNVVQDSVEVPRRERNLRTPQRTSRRSNTPIAFQGESKVTKNRSISSLALESKLTKEDGSENVHNHFLESNSSISSASSHSSSTLTSTIAGTSNNASLSMATQIDLTMSSSSSNSNGSTTNTLTTVEATARQCCVMIGNADNCGIGNVGGSSNNSMLPPATILSSSDPLQDVVFRPNDFSSIIATQQLRGTHLSIDQKSELSESQDEGLQDDASGADNSEDDSASSSSMSATPGRGRGRGRGVRGGRSSGRGHRSHRLSRGASAVAKAIALNRPRCVGALKHTPDPERIKGLYSPSPQVFEEDTRMSAELTQTSLQEEPVATPISQTDFFTNEESQSSIISNNSILDPNNVIAVQNGSAVKKPIKKKKMEVCVSEDTDFTVASIAEYDWPPPKGCCPSKNRDTFMIQEQVAMYLGIKSFKRKYPDLPRRQVDMEERNWLQEKGLVSEKMCDLGITAVWASDILDIMYTDFYDKYEEYKDFVRQKHLREIEAKQKSLGLNVAGRGLQARERAMLSTSKWNSYFNRTRKDERLSCLDLQTLIVNKPCPAAAPISAIHNRPIAEAVALAAKAERIDQPPTLLKPRVFEPPRPRDVYYPLSLVPGQFCERYYNYSTWELRCFPLNTVLNHPFKLRQNKDHECNSSDTDSAVESIDNKTDVDKASNSSASKRHSKRRVRRTRYAANLSNDEFKIPPIPGAASISATSTTDSCSSSEESSSETDSESTCSSTSSEESSDDEYSAATCGVCLRPQNRNLNNIPELFVQCYTCRRKVHPSCIEMPHRMATRVRNYNWQCADCKCCIKCKRKQDQNKMLFCEQCDRGFHIYCLEIKAVPDGRWSCDRCCICMRCGSTKPEGLSLVQQQLMNSPNGEKIKQVKHKKVKWINEYRLDHITKLREHCSMLCVPCARLKTTKRVQIATYNNTTATFLTSPGSSRDLSPNYSSSISYNLPSATSQQTLPSSLTVTATSNIALTQTDTTTEAITSSIAPTTTTAAEAALVCSENKDAGPLSSTSRNSPTSLSTTSTTESNTTGGPPPVVA